VDQHRNQNRRQPSVEEILDEDERNILQPEPYGPGDGALGNIAAAGGLGIDNNGIFVQTQAINNSVDLETYMNAP